LHVVAHEGDIITTLKNLNLKDVAFFLLAAWDAVQPKTIRASWNPLLGKESILEEESTDIVGDASQEITLSLSLWLHSPRADYTDGATAADRRSSANFSG
jgi:hypothetical protein